MEQRAQLFFHHPVRRKCLEKQGFGNSLSLDALPAACKRSAMRVAKQRLSPR
jgi:hypothetical protein